METLTSNVSESFLTALESRVNIITSFFSSWYLPLITIDKWNNLSILASFIFSFNCPKLAMFKRNSEAFDRGVLTNLIDDIFSFPILSSIFRTLGGFIFGSLSKTPIPAILSNSAFFSLIACLALLILPLSSSSISSPARYLDFVRFIKFFKPLI